jgi:hypothetical protein
MDKLLFAISGVLFGFGFVIIVYELATWGRNKWRS